MAPHPATSCAEVADLGQNISTSAVLPTPGSPLSHDHLPAPLLRGAVQAPPEVLEQRLSLYDTGPGAALGETRRL